MIKVSRIVNSPVPSNCFVLYETPISNSCIIIDPGTENNDSLINYLEVESLLPQYIILTHEHFDHCWGVNNLRRRYPNVKLVCTTVCSISIQDIRKNYSLFYQQPGFKVNSADILIDMNDWRLKWNSHDLLFTPAKGHSDSGIIIRTDRFLFTGDSLIKDIKTVTYFKSGSKVLLKDTIKYIETVKGNNLMVCPGHGDMFLLDEYDLSLAI